MLRDLIGRQITFDTFVGTFKQNNVNGVYNFLKRKQIYNASDFHKIDDIEARHLMD